MKAIALVFSLYSFGVFAQGATDARLWTGASLNYNLSKKIKVGLEQQFRFDQNISNYSRSVSELGLKWKMSKRFSLAGGLRYSGYPDQLNNYRVSGDLAYNWKKKKKVVSFKNRLRYQRKQEFTTRDITSYLRNKLVLGFNASKLLDPYVMGEIFYRLDTKNEFRVWRAGGGLEWRLMKNLDLVTYYQLEQEFNKKNNDRTHIIGAMVKWDIN